MKRLELDIDGERVEGWVEKVDGVLWLKVDGRTFSFEPPKKARRGGKGGGAAAHGEIHAPMPGKVTKIMVAPGDAVSEGQVVVVLEAMKMEYTLKSQVGGKVGSVGCKVGDQVALGACLVKIDPEKANP